MSDRPNILFIMSDQLIAALTGAYGHPVVQTPHLNRLAAEGVRFDSAYTPFPLCAPGRACITSGRHASEIGAWDNGALLAADVPSYAHYLSNAGYDTVLSGKMHFVGPDQVHGFHRRLTTDIYPPDFSWVKEEWIRIKETKGEDYEEVMDSRPTYNAGGYTGQAVRVNFWHNALSYDEETQFRAVEYLRAQRGDTPFLLCASFHHPHEPFHPPQAYWDRYADAEIAIPEFPDHLDETYSAMDRWLNAYHGTRRFDLRDSESLRRLRRAYYGLVTYLDDKVGGLLATLEETGLLDNTVVVFTSDHGDMLCEKEMVQKRCFYEWSCRVPLIVRFPNQWQAGTTVDTPTSLLDLLPTFCELAGAEASLPHDGTSLLPIIEGQQAGTPHLCPSSRGGGRALHHGPRGPVQIQLHPPATSRSFLTWRADPGEWNNLAGVAEHAATETRLRGLILDRFDPDKMVADNLDSLYRRRLIRDVMYKHDASWNHTTTFRSETRGARPVSPLGKDVAP